MNCSMSLRFALVLPTIDSPVNKDAVNIPEVYMYDIMCTATVHIINYYNILPAES